MTYKDLIKAEPRIADEKPSFDRGFLLCGNCRSMPASATLSESVGWIGCAPCITGEAASFDDGDLVLKKAP